MVSDDVREIVDAFYSRFLLRDLFGKVVPGFIAIGAGAASLTSFQKIFEFIGNMSLGAWVVAIGIGWLSGFAVQSFGEFTHLIIYYPRNNLLLRYFSKPVTRDRHVRIWSAIRKELLKIDDIEKVKNLLAHVHFESDEDFYEF